MMPTAKTSRHDHHHHAPIVGNDNCRKLKVTCFAGFRFMGVVELALLAPSRFIVYL